MKESQRKKESRLISKGDNFWLDWFKFVLLVKMWTLNLLIFSTLVLSELAVTETGEILTLEFVGTGRKSSILMNKSGVVFVSSNCWLPWKIIASYLFRYQRIKKYQKFCKFDTTSDYKKSFLAEPRRLLAKRNQKVSNLSINRYKFQEKLSV